MHESCYNIGLLQALDLEYDFKLRDDYVPQINISHDESSGNFDLFREDLKSSEKEIDKPLIFIHPGMTGHTLNWSSRNYARLFPQDFQITVMMYQSTLFIPSYGSRFMLRPCGLSFN